MMEINYEFFHGDRIQGNASWNEHKHGYVHTNYFSTKYDHSANPHIRYVVVWDDGNIENLAYDEIKKEVDK
jgi:hypothetical protein